jgi:hypothetical protein
VPEIADLVGLGRELALPHDEGEDLLPVARPLAQLRELGERPGVVLVGGDHLAEDGLGERVVPEHRLGEPLGLAAEIARLALETVERREPPERPHEILLAAGRPLKALDRAQDILARRVLLEGLLKRPLRARRIAEPVLPPASDAHPEIRAPCRS